MAAAQRAQAASLAVKRARQNVDTLAEMTRVYAEETLETLRRTTETIRRSDADAY